MAELPSETDVLIVGGGPVGSALACELALRNVACMVVDPVGELSDLTIRATNLTMRTAEHLRRWGCAQRVRDDSDLPAAFRVDLVMCTALFGRELGAFRAYGWREEDSWDLSSEPALLMPQYKLNRVLRAHAVENGAVGAFGWSVTMLTQGVEGVTAMLVSADGERTRPVRARYAVGCDGARGRTRADAGLTMSRSRERSKWVGVAVQLDVLTRLTLTPAGFYLVLAASNGALLQAINHDLWNFHIAGFAADEDTEAIDFDPLVRSLIGRDDLDHEIKAVIPYVVRERFADSYRADAIFIAGDAAHVIAPVGGHGANTGIGDAADIGWKLAAVLGGWGGDRLLESYTAERRPIALAVAREGAINHDALVDAWAQLRERSLPDGDGAQAQAARHEAAQRFFELTKREWRHGGVSLDQRYEDSPVIVPDGTQPPPWDATEPNPCARPGHRAPLVRDRDGSPIFDRFGNGFTLLAFGAQAPEIVPIVAAAAHRSVPLTILEDDDPKTRAAYGASLVLIRPDQHVAWRGARADDPLALIDIVRGACEGGASRHLPR
jgi:2-polyprenyl-6-methoxyphenol hydroxylase-like FAD-dependent oxidoreductase